MLFNYKNILLLNFTILILGCKQSIKEPIIKNDKKETELLLKKSSSKNIQIVPILDIETHIKNYNGLKKRIKNYKSKHKNSPKEIVSEKMSTILIDSIFPYWLGTKWDFNGYTETPLQGEVACGYFVSTTIRDLGIKINRFKIAQKGATDIIKSLCNTEKIKTFSSFQKLETYVNTLNNNELMIVGLDFHVGFIYKKKNKIYFTHSNYIDRKGVEIELFNESIALKNSNLYVLGNFSNSDIMITKWKS